MWPYGYYGVNDGAYVHTYFSTIEISKDENGNDVFEYKVYKSKLDKATEKITETNVVDTYTITKTK